MEFTFTLKYQLDTAGHDRPFVEKRLLEERCDDAIMGSGMQGRLALEFTREARSARDALSSAIRDVGKALPTAKLIEAAPDLVGLTDVSEIAGISRQAMRKLMLRKAGDFPPPVHEGKASLWHLADLLNWMSGRGYAVDPVLVQTSEAALEANHWRTTQRLRGAPKARIQRFL